MKQSQEVTKIYNHAAETIKTAILQGQYEAAKGVNRVQLLTNFAIGKYVSINTRNGVWGTGALKAISERLRKILPGLRGYGETQLKEMRLFYEGWSFIDNKSSVVTDDLPSDNSSVATDELQVADNVCDIMSLIKLSRLPIFQWKTSLIPHSLIIPLSFVNAKATMKDSIICTDVLRSAYQLKN